MPSALGDFAAAIARAIVWEFAAIACAIIGFIVLYAARRRHLTPGPGHDLFALSLAMIGVGLLGISGWSLFRFITALQYPERRGWVIAITCVVLFGSAVGAAELISRYKDNPLRALLTAPGFFYVALNGAGSAAALYLIYVYRDNIGFTGEWNDGTLVKAVLVAGSASLVFFRSAIFKFRVGDSDLAIGPSIVLDTLLTAADRAVDRVMAGPRAVLVHGLMKDVAFEKAAVILPQHCISLMQNVSGEESQRIVSIVNKLRADKESPNKIKTLNLGLALLSVVGERVLRTAVEFLYADLQDSTAKLLEEVAIVMDPVSFDKARRILPTYCFALWPSTVPDEIAQKLASDLNALSQLGPEAPESYKSLYLGIRLARITDGATLRKAVEDLGSSIRAGPAGARPVVEPAAEERREVQPSPVDASRSANSGADETPSVAPLTPREPPGDESATERPGAGSSDVDASRQTSRTAATSIVTPTVTGDSGREESVAEQPEQQSPAENASSPHDRRDDTG